ncbi:MAG: ROK family protein, partial [Verrucomicrobiaceae bacterium]
MSPPPPTSIEAPLDPGFSPSILFNREYTAAARASGKSVPLVLALERENALVSRHKTVLMPTADEDTLRYVERLVKFLLWSRGGWRLIVGGPPEIGSYLKEVYSAGGAREFDCRVMAKAYGKEFTVEVMELCDVPPAREMRVRAGGHLSGCRIGFDLGASDYKVCAVIDGEPVFTHEVPWDPKSQADPGYHYHHLSSALHHAAA